MTITERHELIVKELDAKGSVSVTELSMMLNVSEVTIRKDLTLLEEKNVCSAEELEESGRDLMGYIKETYHYRPERVSQALDALTDGEEGEDA